jgi:serine/threonine protein kinase
VRAHGPYSALHDSHLPRQHDHIVTYNDGWRNNNTVWIVMENNNKTLREIIDEKHRSKEKFSEEVIMHYIGQIIDAVQFMHANNVSHNNLIVCENCSQINNH